MDQTTTSGMTPIMAAASQGHIETVKFLADKGASLEKKDKNDQTIIHLAAQNNQDEVITAILDLESTPKDFMVNENDQLDNTPLHLACSAGHLESVKVLIQAGAESDNKNEDEKTPFHMAAERGHVDVVEYILNNDKNAKNDCDEDDNTALHLAASNKMTNTVEMLLEFGSDVRKRNNKDWTPLDCAAASGSYNCVLKILEAGSDLDPMDKKQTTPLHLTAIHGHAHVTRLLMEWGAKIEIENTDGKNALELAIEHGHKVVAEAILSSPHWRKAMISSNIGTNEWLDTPLRMLIRKFPSLAVKVLDNCITKESVGAVDQNNNSTDVKAKVQYKFDYSFLEDTYNYKRHVIRKEEDIPSSGDKATGEVEKIKFDWDPHGKKPYSRSALVIQNNHPLLLMCKQQHKTLMKHPLCLALLRHKWNKFQFLFWFYILFYLFYLGLITAFVMMDLDLISSDTTNRKTLNGLRCMGENSSKCALEEFFRYLGREAFIKKRFFGSFLIFFGRF